MNEAGKKFFALLQERLEKDRLGVELWFTTKSWLEAKAEGQDFESHCLECAKPYNYDEDDEDDED